MYYLLIIIIYLIYYCICNKKENFNSTTTDDKDYYLNKIQEKLIISKLNFNKFKTLLDNYLNYQISNITDLYILENKLSNIIETFNSLFIIANSNIESLNLKKEFYNYIFKIHKNRINFFNKDKKDYDKYYFFLERF